MQDIEFKDKVLKILEETRNEAIKIGLKTMAKSILDLIEEQEQTKNPSEKVLEKVKSFAEKVL